MLRNRDFRLIGALTALLVAVTACVQRRDDATVLSEAGQFACSVSGQLVSGSTTAASSTVVLSNITVSLFNSGTGPYVIRLADSTNNTTLSSVTVSTTSHTIPGNMSLRTGTAGGIAALAEVTDQDTGLFTSCTVNAGTSGTTSGMIAVAASPSTTQTTGGTISLTATASSLTDPRFSFSQTNTMAAGAVTLFVTGNSTANVTSTQAGTVTVMVNVMNGTGTAVLATTSITLTFTGTTGGTGGYATYINVTASPSLSVSPGTPVTLTASAPGATTQSFTFAPSSFQSGTSVSTVSSTQATVTSTTGTTVYVVVSLAASFNNSYPLSTTIPVTFTGSTTTPTVSLVATNGSSASVNQWINLTASVSGISNPVYDFHQKHYTESGVVISNYANGTASVKSDHVSSPVIEVIVTSGSNSAISARAEITLSFGGSGGGSGTSFNCTLTHLAGYYRPGDNVFFNITSTNNEAVIVTYWDAGEPWSNPPGNWIRPPLFTRYDYPGTKYVRITAVMERQPWVTCNGGSYLTDTVVVY